MDGWMDGWMGQLPRNTHGTKLDSILFIESVIYQFCIRRLVLPIAHPGHVRSGQSV